MVNPELVMALNESGAISCRGYLLKISNRQFPNKFQIQDQISTTEALRLPIVAAVSTCPGVASQRRRQPWNLVSKIHPHPVDLRRSPYRISIPVFAYTHFTTFPSLMSAFACTGFGPKIVSA